MEDTELKLHLEAFKRDKGSVKVSYQRKELAIELNVVRNFLDLAQMGNIDEMKKTYLEANIDTRQFLDSLAKKKGWDIHRLKKR
jgi:hypothetical protein